MEQEYREYVTFQVTARDGRQVEMAVVDEFDFENKHYVVACVVEEDAIKEDGQYIYRAIVKDDDFAVEEIRNAIDYKRVVDAYLDLDD